MRGIPWGFLPCRRHAQYRKARGEEVVERRGVEPGAKSWATLVPQKILTVPQENLDECH